MSSDAGGKGTTPAERRASTRVPVEMWIEDLTDGQVFRRAANLSVGGLYLDQTIPHPVGTPVRLRFSLPDDPAPLELQGVIVSVATGEAFGMGVKFVDLAPEMRTRLEEFTDRRLTPPVGAPVR